MKCMMKAIFESLDTFLNVGNVERSKSLILFILLIYKNRIRIIPESLSLLSFNTSLHEDNSTSNVILITSRLDEKIN